VIPEVWRDFVMKHGAEGKPQIKRIDYELGVLHTLREKLRCKDLWIAGACRFRNPDEDLPADFAAQRTEYFAAIKQPLDAEVFIADLKQKMPAALEALDHDLPTIAHVKLTDCEGGWIRLRRLTTRGPSRAAPPGPAEGRDQPTVADDQSAGHSERNRPARAFYRSLQNRHRLHPAGPNPPAKTVAPVLVWPGDEHRSETRQRRGSR
jgi:hypothetical protein